MMEVVVDLYGGLFADRVLSFRGCNRPYFRPTQTVSRFKFIANVFTFPLSEHSPDSVLKLLVLGHPALFVRFLTLRDELFELEGHERLVVALSHHSERLMMVLSCF
jgi:hypothetical protein